MTGQEVAFVVIAALGTIAALRVVSARNVVHAALYLVVTLATVAGAYLLLSAEFIVNSITLPRGTPACSVTSGAGGWVGPMIKLPLASAGGTSPSGSSTAST